MQYASVVRLLLASERLDGLMLSWCRGVDQALEGVSGADQFSDLRVIVVQVFHE